MTRMKQCFETLSGQQRKALIPYITAGDPLQSVTVPSMHAMVLEGADIIELGVPFSDPMADGPSIQLACERALAQNTRLLDVLWMVEEFRRDNQHTPVVLMGYLNPIEVMGYEKFAQAAEDAGLDAVLTVDLPPEEAEGVFTKALEDHNLDIIYLLAPTTETDRIKKICKAAQGYLYYVSVKGTTGSKKLDVQSVADKLDLVREHTELPIGVGFGIRDEETAKAVSEIADAVIVGSVLVDKMASLADTPEKIPAAISAIVAELRSAMDSK